MKIKMLVPLEGPEVSVKPQDVLSIGDFGFTAETVASLLYRGLADPADEEAEAFKAQFGTNPEHGVAEVPSSGLPAPLDGVPKNPTVNDLREASAPAEEEAPAEGDAPAPNLSL